MPLGNRGGGAGDPSHTGSFHTYCTLGHSQRDMEGQLGKYGTIFTVARFTTPPLIRTESAVSEAFYTAWSFRA